MYKGAARSEQIRHQLAGLRQAVAVAGGADAVASGIDRLRDLQRAIVNLDERIVAAPKGSPRRKQLGAQKHLMATEIAALRAKLRYVPKGNAEFANYFMDAAAELLLPGTFEQLCVRAREIAASFKEATNGKGESCGKK